MKILITGGTGFLGSHCALHLASQGHEVTALGRNIKIGTELQNQGIRFISIDLEENDKLTAAVSGQDRVIHTAALNARWAKYSDYYKANVLGTKAVINACLENSIEHLVHLSSPSVYFNYADRIGIREDEPLPNSQSHYAQTKRLADAAIQEALQNYQLSCVTLRPRAIVGPGDKNILGRISKAAKNGIITLPRGGQTLIDLTSIENAVQAVTLALNPSPNAIGKIFNISNGEPMMLAKLSESLGLQVRSIPFPIAHLFAILQEIHAHITKQQPLFTREIVGLISYHQTLDITLAREILGYVPNNQKLIQDV